MANQNSEFYALRHKTIKDWFIGSSGHDIYLSIFFHARIFPNKEAVELFFRYELPNSRYKNMPLDLVKIDINKFKTVDRGTMFDD